MDDECECLKRRKKYGVSEKQFRNISCDDLACWEECHRDELDTLTSGEQERYLAGILKNKSALELVAEIPKVEDLVISHYMDKMFEMKEAEITKRNSAV